MQFKYQRVIEKVVKYQRVIERVGLRLEQPCQGHPKCGNIVKPKPEITGHGHCNIVQVKKSLGKYKFNSTGG